MKVVVAMSGGVDSTLAAALLGEQGHAVSGCTLLLVDPPAGAASPDAAAAHLGIWTRLLNILASGWIMSNSTRRSSGWPGLT